MEVSRLGVKSAVAAGYTIATAMPDLSGICDLHHSSQQHQTLNPLRKTGFEPASSWILIGFITAEPQWNSL